MDLSKTELVAGLAPDDAEQVLGLGHPMHVPSGTALFHLGELADRVFVVERGRIALTMPMQVRQQEEAVLVEERLPGETVGWSALIPPHRFTLNASAPLETDVIVIPRQALLDYLVAHPSVAYLITRNLAEIMGQRLQVFQAMWLREMQRTIELRAQPARGVA
jgi:CRP-like cAMP-binding protein